MLIVYTLFWSQAVLYGFKMKMKVLTWDQGNEINDVKGKIFLSKPRLQLLGEKHVFNIFFNKHEDEFSTFEVVADFITSSANREK